MTGAAAIVALIVAGALYYKHANREAADLPDRPGEFFSWDELKTTNTGLPNDPDAPTRARLLKLTNAILDPWRHQLGQPVIVTSAYRSPAVNQTIGGASQSQHMTGEAADLVVEGWSSVQSAAHLAAAGLPFDQIVYYAYHPHVHVSHRANGAQRGEILYSPAPDHYTRVGAPS